MKDVEQNTSIIVVQAVMTRVQRLAPVRQVLRTDPWQVMKTGSTTAAGGRWFSGRDVLMVGQIALCSVLVTASLVAVGGLVRSLHSNFGFQPMNVPARQLT